MAPSSRKGGQWASRIAWMIALVVVSFTAHLGWRTYLTSAAALQPTQAATQLKPSDTPKVEINPATLPEFSPAEDLPAVYRHPDLKTIIPERPRQEVVTYTVETGDAIFGIAQAFKIKPDTILWANYDLLNDNPDMISVGMELKIPPTDGVLYEVKAGDTIQSVASAFNAQVEDILSWSGNKLDLTNPLVEPGALVMVPGGHREFRQWLIPTIPRGPAGVSTRLLGPGACEGGYEGAYGSGALIWPADNHTLSGNDYWAGHLGIDIAAGLGALVYAADNGVVVFSGGAYGGYGSMIMIDHGNGYQTLYAHLSVIYAGCGKSVWSGQTIGLAGNSGNSTGPHLHFEVRYLGGYVSPWYVLPAP
jgi:murein DD-endopeptidase MepM/ murein hydrolase activator NlpD